MAELSVHVQLVEMVTGLWCRTCALPSGIQVTVSMWGAVRPGLSTARRCAECNGTDVEPVGPDD